MSIIQCSEGSNRTEGRERVNFLSTLLALRMKKGPQAKECRWPLEAVKDEETDSKLELFNSSSIDQLIA